MESNVELQLRRLLGQSVDVPEPRSRVEQLLQQIYEQGGTGGGGSLPSYSFKQTTPSNQWVVQHNLGIQYPTMVCVDTNGNSVFGDVRYVSTNALLINFTSPIAGEAYLK